jgi:hypothetical protein
MEKFIVFFIRLKSKFTQSFLDIGFLEDLMFKTNIDKQNDVSVDVEVELPSIYNYKFNLKVKLA